MPKQCRQEGDHLGVGGIDLIPGFVFRHVSKLRLRRADDHRCVESFIFARVRANILLNAVNPAKESRVLRGLQAVKNVEAKRVIRLLPATNLHEVPLDRLHGLDHVVAKLREASSLDRLPQVVGPHDGAWADRVEYQLHHRWAIEATASSVGEANGPSKLGGLELERIQCALLKVVANPGRDHLGPDAALELRAIEVDCRGINLRDLHNRTGTIRKVNLRLGPGDGGAELDVAQVDGLWTEDKVLEIGRRAVARISLGDGRQRAPRVILLGFKKPRLDFDRIVEIEGEAFVFVGTVGGSFEKFRASRRARKDVSLEGMEDVWVGWCFGRCARG